jgi:hypothetical protein
VNDAAIINDEDKPLTVVKRRPNGGIYLNQAGKAYVVLSDMELRRLIDFTQADAEHA